MSLLEQYTELEAQLLQIQSKIRSLETNKDLKTELEFKQEIEEVMTKYGKDADDLVSLLKPQASKTMQKQSRKPRKLKIFKNPHSGEVVETYGGNNKVLREWKEEYGTGAVEDWLLTT
jgi:DNA-binding protein H-NS